MKNAEEKQRVYTVAIDEYRANFATMDEVESFLEKVKASADAADEYGAVIADQGSDVSGILTASLARRDAGLQRMKSAGGSTGFSAAGRNQRLCDLCAGGGICRSKSQV